MDKLKVLRSGTTVPDASTTAAASPAARRQDKLKALRQRILDVEEDNKKEVLSEAARKSHDFNQDLRVSRKRKEAELLLDKLESEKSGVDWDRKQNLQYTAEAVDQWNTSQETKTKRMDVGFASFADANLRKHEKLIDNIKPDLVAYENAKSLQNDDEGVFRDANSLAYGNPVDNKPKPEAVDRMVKDLEKQLERRMTHSRRRKFDPDADVSYINDKNMRFNQKIARAYDKYTEEIRQSFERGTAL